MNFESYNFSDDFQDCILACLIRHPDEFFGFGQIIRPEFFNGPAAVEIVQNVQSYHKKYGKFPDFTMLGNYAYHRAARVSVEHAKTLVDYTSKLASVNTSEWQAVLDMAVDFARERAVHVGMREILAAQTEGKLGSINAVQIMEKALSVGTNLNDLGLSLFHDASKVIDTVTRHDYGIQTGYAELDKIWKYGWGPGWLIVPLAPPKRLKTTFCINLAMNMATYGKADVLYYACEISKELAMMRAIYNLTGFTEQEIRDSPEKHKIKVEKVLTEKMWGNVWFMSFPAKGVTMAQIEAHAKQVIQIKGLNPKAIFIDYAETVKPDTSEKGTPDWRQQVDVYVQARAMGTKLGCCVIMPDRCNKETVDQKVPSMKSFQGSFEKAGAVDVAIGLCATDAEFMQRKMRYFVFLNRHGEAMQHFVGRSDLDRMRMTIDKEIGYDPEEEDKLAEEKRRAFGRGKSKATASALEFEQTQRD